MIFGSMRHGRVFVYREPVDMRKAYDTLSALVEGPMRQSLLSGDVFVFIGRTRKRAKALYFDGTGLCVLYKKLQGRSLRKQFRFLSDGSTSTLSIAEVGLLLEGARYTIHDSAARDPEANL